LATTDWRRLHHAYGRAADTPGHLRALLEDDPKARDKAIDHLFSAIIHEETPWTATGPAALVVAGLLADEQIDRVETMRAELLQFLVCVAEVAASVRTMTDDLERKAAAFDLEPLTDLEDDEEASAFWDTVMQNEEATEAFGARSQLGCIGAAPAIYQVMLDGLGDRGPLVRSVAGLGAVMLAWHGDVAELGSRLLALANRADDMDERSAHVLALGQLGFSPAAFLNDPSPAVRLCAALAPSLSADPGATDELLGATEKHAREIDGWFTQKPPQFPRKPRFYVVARLIERVGDFDRLAAAAIAVVRITKKSCIDDDWGPLLASAFPKGTGAIDTDAQRRFLSALVRNTKLWDPKLEDADKWFRRAGLPYDRDACASLAELA
jgi:hypothetical protein